MVLQYNRASTEKRNWDMDLQEDAQCFSELHLSPSLLGFTKLLTEI